MTLYFEELSHFLQQFLLGIREETTGITSVIVYYDNPALIPNQTLWKWTRLFHKNPFSQLERSHISLLPDHM